MNNGLKDILSVSFVLFVFFMLGVSSGRSVERNALASDSSLAGHFSAFHSGFRSSSDLRYCDNFVDLEQKMYCLGFRGVSYGSG